MARTTISAPPPVDLTQANRDVADEDLEIQRTVRRFADEQGRTLYDLPRASVVAGEVRAPARFLPAFDSIILAHRDRSRIVPAEYLETVFNTKNATTKQTFTVDGFVAGAWRAERKRGRWTIELDPFAGRQPFDDLLFVGEPGLAQFCERR